MCADGVPYCAARCVRVDAKLTTEHAVVAVTSALARAIYVTSIHSKKGRELSASARG